MIYGYYCIYPERIDENPEVQKRANRIERLQSINAPEVIMMHEHRMLKDVKEKHSDVRRFRERINGLYVVGKESAILENYKTVFEDVGFDPKEVYGAHALLFDGTDYLRPVKSMTDEEIIRFLERVCGKFADYSDKYKETLEKIRKTFIRRYKYCVDNGIYPESAGGCIARLEELKIEIDDGFTTTLDEVSGWYNAHRNIAVISAVQFKGVDVFTLLHEMAHACAGDTDGVKGFYRLEEFLGEEYEAAYELMNETFANARAIHLLGLKKIPDWLLLEQARDLKVEIIVRRSGKEDIDKDMFSKAYFSDDIADVEALANAIKTNFDADALLSDLASIKDTSCVNETKYKGKDKSKELKYRNKHRHDNIDGCFRYYYFGNPRVRARTGEMLMKILLAKQFFSDAPKE